MSINLRKSNRTKREKEMRRYGNSISTHQQAMMNFYKENRRCVINAPRQSGKSTFLIMQAILSNDDTIMIAKTKPMVEFNKTLMHDFCCKHNIDHQVRRDRIVLTKTNTEVRFASPSRFNDLVRGFYGNVFIDEYQFIDINELNLIDISHCIMIGTHTLNEFDFNPIGAGLFAGLNITQG